MRTVEAGGCAPPVIIPGVKDRIREYLHGEADYDQRKLLVDALEEIQQLECAARMALQAAERRAGSNPPAPDSDKPAPPPNPPPAHLIGLDVPADVLLAANTVEQHFKRKGVDHWQLLGIESRDYGTATA